MRNFLWTPLDHVENQTFKEWSKGTKQDANVALNRFLALDLVLIHYYYMEHVSDRCVPCHEHHATCLKVHNLQYVSHLNQFMKYWIMDNIRLSSSTTQIMTTYEYQCFKHGPTWESWTWNHYVFPHNTSNAMKMNVSLEYKWHQGMLQPMLGCG